MLKNEGFFVGLAMAVLAIVFVALALADHAERYDCEERGGRYVEKCSQSWILVYDPVLEQQLPRLVENCAHECVEPAFEVPHMWPTAEYQPCPDDPLTDCSDNKGSDRR